MDEGGFEHWTNPSDSPEGLPSSSDRGRDRLEDAYERLESGGDDKGEGEDEKEE